MYVFVYCSSVFTVPQRDCHGEWIVCDEMSCCKTHQFVSVFVCVLTRINAGVCDEVLNWAASHWARFTCHKTYSLYWPEQHTHTDTKHLVTCPPLIHF